MSDKRHVGVFLETSRKAGRSLLRGIIRYAEMAENWAFYREPPFYTQRNLKRTSTILSRLERWNVNGIFTEEPHKFDQLIRRSVPVIILISSARPYFSRLPRMMSDAGTIAEMAVEHFRERGIHHFAFCGYDDVFWSQERSKNYIEKASQLKFSTYLYRQPRGRHKRLWENEILHLAQWLCSLPKPVGILCCNDERGVEVIEACREAKIRIPEDAAVLGVDDDDLVCTLNSPQLSSISLDFENTGWEAAHLLDQLMQGKTMNGQQIAVRPQNITARHSTDILAVDDQTVVQALRYIKENSRRFFNVDDVATATATARRTLEKKFRAALGRTIHDQVRHIHVEQIARLLRETNLTISEIASQMSFENTKNLSRYFRKEKGISPREYRKQYHVYWAKENPSSLRS